MIDKVKLIKKISYKFCLLAKSQLEKTGRSKVMKLGTGKLGDILQYEFFDENKKIYFRIIPKLCTISVEFNLRTFRGTSNVGTLTTKQVDNCIKDIRTYISNLLNIKIDSLRRWKASNIEISNDYIAKSLDEKDEILKALKKNNAGHLKSYNFENNNMYLVNKSIILKAYDKFNELMDKGKEIKLPTDVSMNQLKRMIRVEVEIKHKKMIKILKSAGIKKKEVLLKDLLNPYILHTLFNSVLERANMGCSLKNVDDTQKEIKAKVKSIKMQDKLIEFLNYIANNSVLVAKNKYKRAFYRYKDKLQKMGIGILCSKNLVRNICLLINYSFKSQKYLERFMEFFKIRSSKAKLCITSVLFDIFIGYSLKLRL